MINAPMNAGMNPSTVNPSIKVETNQNNPAFITNVKRPSVRRVIGNVKITKIGFRIKLTNPSTTATISAM